MAPRTQWLWSPFLEGLKQMAMLRALFPNAIFTVKPNQNAVHAPVTFHSRTLHFQVSALIDSGATENFISLDLIKHFFIPTYKIPRPKVVRNIDKTKNNISNVTLTATLKIYYQDKVTEHTFYIIGLGDNHMLLEMPFLCNTNPHINCTNEPLNKIAKSSNLCQTKDQRILSL